MESSTEARNRSTTQDLLCKTGSYAAYQKLLVSAVNIPLSITAFLGNILIIIALSRVSSLRPPSKLLLGCLASTDLCVGLITQPLFVAYIMSSEHSMLCYYFLILFTRLSITPGGVSVSTLTAISVDRLLALLLGLRYKHVVTLRRVQSYVVIIWIFSIVNTLTSSYDPRITRSITFSATILCIVTSIFSYTKNLPDASQPSSSSARACSPRTAKRKSNATEYNSIQKDSVQCIVDTDNISCLLSSLWHRGYLFHQWITNAISSSCMGTSTISVYAKLDLKPTSLLLED